MENLSLKISLIQNYLKCICQDPLAILWDSSREKGHKLLLIPLLVSNPSMNQDMQDKYGGRGIRSVHRTGKRLFPGGVMCFAQGHASAQGRASQDRAVPRMTWLWANPALLHEPHQPSAPLSSCFQTAMLFRDQLLPVLSTTLCVTVGLILGEFT